MTKEEFLHIYNLEKSEIDKKGITGITMQVQADIARQLTRIADQGDDTAKARDHSVEQMMSALAGTPADDALVEAVEKYLATITLSPSDKCCFTLDDLKTALAAHEKAVR